MFKPLSTALAANPTLDANDVFSLHPLQLVAYLEAISEAWRLATTKRPDPTAAPGDPGIGGIDMTPGATLGSLKTPLKSMIEVMEGNIQSLKGGNINNAAVVAAIETVVKQVVVPGTRQAVRPWHHLIYAYLIENTRVVDVGERLLRDALHSERLGAFSDASYRWLRSTEMLFFKPGESPLLSTITSNVRPNPAATFRNAYFRMFGFDLTHGLPDGSPYPYEKPEIANKAFGKLFEHFLREVWRGYIHATNQSGPKTSDDAAILDDIEKLAEMLGDRRQKNRRTLAREEFVAVTVMSWFDLTVASNTPIVDDLKASASTPEERLHLLGKRVGVPTHANAGSLFELSERVALLLTMIEEKQFTSTNVKDLYTPTPGNTLSAMMLEIINHWAKATSTDLKSVPVAAPAAMAAAV